MSFTPTPQQEMAAHYFCDGLSMSIEALAGTGKTTSLAMLANHPDRPNGRMLYTAFSKKVIEEAKEKFPRHVAVRTNHSLAWGFGAPYKAADRLVGRITPDMVMNHPVFNQGKFRLQQNPITVTRWILLTLNRFCESSDETIQTRHSLPAIIHATTDNAEAVALARSVATQARSLWDAMMDLKDGQSRLDDQGVPTVPYTPIPITHDVYLKKWALTRPRLNYEIILLDEGQDANPVIVDVIKQQRHAQLVVVGDRQQAIFGFRGAIDAMDAFDVQAKASLTKSFRFGPQIAEVANAILEVDCESSMQIEGDDNQPGRVGKIDRGRYTFIARTNASIIREIVRTRMATPHLKLAAANGVAELITWVRGVDQLFANQRPRVPELSEFTNWNELKEAAEHEAYGYLRKLVQLVEELGTAILLYHLESIRGNETDESTCDIIFSTAHSAKGREWDHVKLANDYPQKGPPGMEYDDGWSAEEANLLYVASTRARKTFDPTECEAVGLAWGDRDWPV